MRTDILGVGFDGLGKKEAVGRALDMLDAPGTHYVVTPNPEIVRLCMKDGKVAEAVNGADMVLPDGIGIVYASRILKRPIGEKVAGIDFALGLLEEMGKRKRRVFLLGAKPGVAEKAAAELAAKFPGLVVCGEQDGYFGDDVPVIETVNDSGADVLLVCLGAPKQELWMHRHKGGVNVRLMIGLGGALDVFAGEVKRAPDIWIKLGLEWLYRLLREPRRIGRMCSLPVFMLAVLRRRMKEVG